MHFTDIIELILVVVMYSNMDEELDSQFISYT